MQLHPDRAHRLSPAVERALIVATEAGDRDACAELVEAFMPAIGGAARHYQHTPSVSRSELLQEGVVGLLRAARRYDPDMGTPFWAYATWWVRQAMQQLVAELTRPVVLSDRAARRLARIKHARNSHLQEFATEPSKTDLAAATDMTLEQLETLLAVEQPPRGLNAPIGDGSGPAGTLEELLGDPEAEDEYAAVLERVRVVQLRDLRDCLGEREQHVVSAHYGLGCPQQTLREIASVLKLSVERVRQVEAAALERLRVRASGL